ncbi:MAG: hypothetical protein COA84_14910 [Robiginitomaculum sp.]|nr:MAG: hypothetical protein COA84_14910 [Robiginitomaculum sp.]
MEAKYLSDGRKVVVIGQLNNIESIVQEVFVSDSGDQIPSGEKFTTKNLHDEPVKSWKEREAVKVDLMYDRKTDELNAIKHEIRTMQSKRSSHAKIIASNLRQIKELESMDVGILADVMARNIKWVCSVSWAWEKVMTFDEFIEIRSAYDEGVKLISVHARNDNTLMYKVGSYSDGSGGESEYKFFTCEDKLKDFLLSKYKSDTEKGYMTVEKFDSIKGFLKLPNSERKALLLIEIDKANEVYKKELARITKQRDKTLNMKKVKQ